MSVSKSRIPFDVKNPYRKRRPATSKIIFLSLEGSVTEEGYFERVSDLFSEVKSRIQLISVAEDAVHTLPKSRTKDQAQMLTKVRPKQLVERIEKFKQEKDAIYQFAQYPEDAFWVVVDVDKNWSNEVIDPKEGKTYLDEWNETVALCQEKRYGYAISNPFFEVWLLLHHDDPTPEDKAFAVTADHAYEKTDHFRTRLQKLHVPLKNKKQIYPSHYTMQNVMAAIQRASALHIDPADLCPHYFATTVYRILQEIVQMMPVDEIGS